VHRYRIAGLMVRSDIEMPGLHPGSPEGEADVTISFGAAPASLAGATAEGPVWTLAGDRFLMRAPGVARFLLTQGRTIVYEPEAAAEAGDIAAFLTGAVFGILLHQRGVVVLHASGVKVGEAAVLFMGSSGAGKSTLATALVQRGYPLVTDDFCVIGYDAGGAPLVHPDARLPKLWSNAIERLDLVARQGQPVRGRLAKFYVDPPVASAPPEPLPCGPVYALREAIGPVRAGIDRPNVVDAALLLRQHAYRARLIKQMGQTELYFRLAAAIGNAGGVHHLSRELDFAQIPRVVDQLERHWSQIGQLAGAT
jgi:hypothetical protein